MTTLLSKNDCYQCKVTERKLTELGVEFQVFKIDEDPEAFARATELGYKSAPVVIAPDGSHWSGFRPDLLGRIAA